jgi:hypothetical protein
MIPFLSVQPSAIKLKVRPSFPSLVSVTSPLTLVKNNGNFQFALDGTALALALAAQFAPLVQRPPASVTPTNNGDLVVQATSNTQLTFKFKGSDGVVRSGNLTLA